MRRTRKWSFVEQEAKRLAALKLSPREIAKQLGLNKSTVTRWMASGKLEKTGDANTDRVEVIAQSAVLTPAEWAAAVRKDFALDATDAQLVTLAESALAGSLDMTKTLQARMTAAGRFQALVKQLALVSRNAPAVAPTVEEPKRKTFNVPRRSGVDPRAVLTAVK